MRALARGKMFPILLLIAIALAGCGGSASDFVATQSGGGATGSSSAPLAVFGRVRLADTIEGATVVALGDQGQTLAGPVTTDNGGAFWLDGTLPESFTLVATLPNDQGTVALPVRGFDLSRRKMIQLNALTTCVNGYLQASPGATLEQAEQAIRDALSVPDSVDLQFGLGESPYSPFSHQAFLQQASQSGGLNALCQQVVQAAMAGEQLSFVLAQGEVRAQTGKAVLNWLGDAAIGLAYGSRNALLTNVFTDITKGLYGWASGAMGWNLGVVGQLDNIQRTLDEVLAQIENLETLVENGFAQLNNVIDKDNLLQTLRDAKSDIASNVIAELQTTLTTLAQQADETDSAGHQYNVPQVNTTVANLIAGYNLSDTENGLNRVTQYQLGLAGQYNINTNLMLLKMVQTGLASNTLPPELLFYPLRRNDILYECYNQLGFYEGVQAALGYLLAETVHTLSPMKTNLDSVTKTLDQLMANVQTQRQQFPDPLPSDDFYFDVENNLVWYLQVTCVEDGGGNFPVTGPLPMAFNFDINGYSKVVSAQYTFDNIPLKFAVPTKAQFQSLIDGSNKLYYAAGGTEKAEYGGVAPQALAGLANLGFANLPAPTEKGNDGHEIKDLGFFVPLLPNHAPFVVPAFEPQPNGDGYGPDLNSGWYVQPYLFFTGSDRYPFAVDYGFNAGVTQKVSGGGGISYDSPDINYPGNAPTYQFLVAPLDDVTTSWANLPIYYPHNELIDVYDEPSPPTPFQMFSTTNPDSTDPAALAPVLRSMFQPHTLTYSVVNGALRVFGNYTLPNGAEIDGVDLTDRVTFSSVEGVVDVSNFPGGSVFEEESNGAHVAVTLAPTNGEAQWHTSDNSQTGTITASLTVGFNTNWDGSSPPVPTRLSVSIPYGGTNAFKTNLTSAPTLTSILITPDNQIAEQINSGTFFELEMIANGFYSDGTMQDLTGQVDWSLEFDNGTPVDPMDGIAAIESKNDTTPGKLRISQQVEPGTEYVIMAKLGAVSDTAQIKADL